MTPFQDSLLTADENRRMFDEIARRYDLLNRLLSLGFDQSWRRKAVKALAPENGAKVLDIGCGTGDIILEILRQFPLCQVCGIDPSAPMLDLARAKIQKAGISDHVELKTGDALALDFADASLGGAISAFCLRNVTERACALAEMKRVLQPAGRAVILELTVPRSHTLRWGHRLYNRHLVPFLGRLLSRHSAYQYLVDSIQDFPEPDIILEMMRAVGFSHPKFFPLMGGAVSIFVGSASAYPR